MVLEAELLVHLVDDLHDGGDLVLDLLGGDVDMGIVLSEAPDAEQPMELSGLLMPVHHTELRQAEREVAVRAGLAGEDDGAAGAVHRLDGVILVVDLGGVHVLLVVVPVAGLLPQVAVEDLRGGDLLVAGGDVDLPPVGHEGVLERDAVRQEEREPGPLFGHHEDAELLAELAVVPLLGLLHHGEVLVEVLLVLEGGAVDAGEHLVVLVAAPVRACDGGELERLALLRVEHVRPGAEVGELALLVEADDGVLGEVLDKLDLVVLVPLLHELDRFGPRKGEGLEFEVLLHDLLHLGLDLGQVVCSEAAFAVHVVVESVADRGTDGQFGLGPEPFDGLREDVRGGVPQHGEAVLGLLHGAVAV